MKGEVDENSNCDFMGGICTFDCGFCRFHFYGKYTDYMERILGYHAVGGDFVLGGVDIIHY